MHNTILGIIAFGFSIYCFIVKKFRVGLGLLSIALSLGLFFLVTLKNLPIDLMGITLTTLFIIGCFLIIFNNK